MRTFSIALLSALLVPGLVAADAPVARIDMTACKDDPSIDAFLRRASPLYAAMARIVELEGGYRIVDTEGVPGGKWHEAGGRRIEVNPEIAGAHRASIIAFEMTNAYQSRIFREHDRAVEHGEITTKTEFALRQELVEYDGLRLHREMLLEIERHLGTIPPEFFFLSNDPKPDSAAKYQLPTVIEHLKNMNASGHTASYFEWFEAHKKQIAAPVD